MCRERKALRIEEPCVFYPSVLTDHHLVSKGHIASSSPRPAARPAQSVLRPPKVATPLSFHRKGANVEKLCLHRNSESNDGSWLPEFSTRSRKVSSRPSAFQNNPLLPRQPGGRDSGNRGLSHLQWRCGPREPPRALGGAFQNSPVSLFVDCIAEVISSGWLRFIFEKVGRVEDVFISAKARKFRKEAFGFVRYTRLQDAKNAINRLDGLALKGMRLKVSLARYSKGGSAITFQNAHIEARKAVPT